VQSKADVLPPPVVDKFQEDSKWKNRGEQNFNPLLLLASNTDERKLKTKIEFQPSSSCCKHYRRKKTEGQNRREREREREREKKKKIKKKAARNVRKKETYMKPSPWLLPLGEEKENEYS
jgi:hypothetical protein